MIFILFLLSTAALTSALEPVKKIELGDEKVKATFSKYLDKIPDISEQYVADERLSRVISHYYDGKISVFPLFKVSVKIDRNPVKIPWIPGVTDGVANLKKEKMKRSQNKTKPIKKRYKFLKSGNKTAAAKKKLRSSIISKSIDKTASNLTKTNKSEKPVQKAYNLAIGSEDLGKIVQNNESLVENELKKSARIGENVSEKIDHKDNITERTVSKIESTTMQIETTISRQDDVVSTTAPPVGTEPSINTTK